MNNFPLEPDVRAFGDERLKNLGRIISGANKNVFLEQPKTDIEKSKLNGRRPDYVLYKKGKDTPLIPTVLTRSKHALVVFFKRKDILIVHYLRSFFVI